MVFLWVLAAERYVPACKSHSRLPSLAPRAAGRGPSAGTVPRHALALPPGQNTGPGRASPPPHAKDVGVWCSTSAALHQNTGSWLLPGMGRKHPRGDEFHMPPTLQMARCQPGTRCLSCQNPSTDLLGRTFLVSMPDSRTSRVGSLPAAACPGKGGGGGGETGPKGLAVAETCPAGGTPGPAAAESHPARSLQLAG